MFHCEPQYSEILLAGLMVTAGAFKTQSYASTLVWLFSATKEDCAISCPALEMCIMGNHRLGCGLFCLKALAAEFLVAPQLSQGM